MGTDILDLIVRIHLGYIFLSLGTFFLFAVLHSGIRNKLAQMYADKVIASRKNFVWDFILFPWHTKRYLRFRLIFSVSIVGFFLIVCAFLSFAGFLW